MTFLPCVTFTAALDVISINVNGCNAHWQDIIYMISKYKSNIICIQETHRLDFSKISSWASNNDFSVFFNSLQFGETWTDQPRDKKLYFLGTLMFVKSQLVSDYNVRHEILIRHRCQILHFENKLGDLDFSVVNLYAPSDVGRAQSDFFRTLVERLTIHSGPTLICGDFNSVVSDLDAKYVANFKLYLSSRLWKDFISVHDYVDIFRSRHPHRK